MILHIYEPKAKGGDSLKSRNLEYNFLTAFPVFCVTVLLTDKDHKQANAWNKKTLSMKRVSCSTPDI